MQRKIYWQNPESIKLKAISKSKNCICIFSTILQIKAIKLFEIALMQYVQIECVIFLFLQKSPKISSKFETSCLDIASLHELIYWACQSLLLSLCSILVIYYVLLFVVLRDLRLYLSKVLPFLKTVSRIKSVGDGWDCA